MFSIAWKPIVSATCYAFASFRDDYMIQRAIGSINHCAALAARFDMPEVFDFLILSLSRVSGLVQAPAEASEVGKFPVVDVEGQKITVSPLAVRFGMNVKAQLAAVVLFAIANNNGRSIRKGWSQIFEIYQTLFTHSLLPPSMLMMEDFLSGTSAIPLKPKMAPTPREERRGDGGLLSTLSSYLLSPYGPSGDMAGTDFTDDDVETTLSAVDCIASCHVDELYSQILCVTFHRVLILAPNDRAFLQRPQGRRPRRARPDPLRPCPPHHDRPSAHSLRIRLRPQLAANQHQRLACAAPVRPGCGSPPRDRHEHRRALAGLLDRTLASRSLAFPSHS